jgi:hypothetical protein
LLGNVVGGQMLPLLPLFITLGLHLSQE